jgi:hypothetical protein
MKLTTPAAVQAAMLEKLKDSKLTKEDAAKLKFKPLTAVQTKELKVPASVAGFMIPYFSLDGKVLSFWRFRYLEDTRKGFDVLNGRKPLRYVQPTGGLNEVYLPPFVDWRRIAENTSHPIVITEGELKAACATKLGVPAIGLGGVYSFKSNKGVLSLLPGLKQFDWKSRQVMICYDSDAATNPMVVTAENQLAKVLIGEGAEVQIARLPVGKDGAKVGIDDYLLDHESSELLELLRSAPPYAASFALHEMNSRVVYIKKPGMVYSYENEMPMRSSDFVSHAYSNYWHDTSSGEKVIRKQTAQEWVNWKHRNELASMTFAPGRPSVTDNKLNLWKGWPITPKKGNVTPWKQLMEHLFGDTEPAVRKWFEQWCAYPLQNPGVKLTSAAVLWGRETGTGKTMVGLALMRIYGRYSTEITDNEVEDTRREWAENMQFVLADDIVGSDSRKLAGILRTMITQKLLKIDKKFVPRYTVPDCINYYFTSNMPDVFYMDETDRRNFIHEVTAGKLDKAQRDAFAEWKDSEAGASALFHYLLELDLTGFDPYAEALVTQAKTDMISLTRSDVATWVAELKLNPDRHLKLPGDLFTAVELLTMYDPMRAGRVTANGLARELKKAGYAAPGNGSMFVTKFGNVRLYAIRNASHWKKQKTRFIIEHYEQNRTMLAGVKPATKVKF